MTGYCAGAGQILCIAGDDLGDRFFVLWLATLIVSVLRLTSLKNSLMSTLFYTAVTLILQIGNSRSSDTSLRNYGCFCEKLSTDNFELLRILLNS